MSQNKILVIIYSNYDSSFEHYAYLGGELHLFEMLRLAYPKFN